MGRSSDTEHSETPFQQGSGKFSEDSTSEHETVEQRKTNKKACRKRKHVKKVHSDSTSSSGSEGIKQDRSSQKRRKGNSDGTSGHGKLRKKADIASDDETEEKSPVDGNGLIASIDSGDETERKESTEKRSRSQSGGSSSSESSISILPSILETTQKELKSASEEIETEEDSSSSCYQPLAKYSDVKQKSTKQDVECMSLASSDGSSDSDKKKKLLSPKERSQNDEESSSKSSTLSDTGDKKGKRKFDQKKVINKRQKDSTNVKINPKIERLKKYLRVAGLRVRSYQKLWEGCKTEKARIEKLLQMLSDAGLKGKPTLQKCKRLHSKRERKEEVESLDASNIIATAEKGRPKRNSLSLYLKQHTTDGEKDSNTFSRIKNIIDSEESE